MQMNDFKPTTLLQANILHMRQVCQTLGQLYQLQIAGLHFWYAHICRHKKYYQGGVSHHTLIRTSQLGRADKLLYIYILHFRAFSRHFCPVIHTYIDTLMAVAARCRPAHQEEIGVQYLAQGQFDMQTRGIEPAPFR